MTHPCYYGVDFPTKKELIAASMDVEAIRKYMDADSLGYLSIAGLLSPFPRMRDYCIACFDGRYPMEKGELLADEPPENPDEDVHLL